MKVKAIDTSTLEGKIEVMQAAANGAKITRRNRHEGDGWETNDVEPKWNWIQYDYAVVVEPREIWVELDRNGGVSDAHPARPATLAAGHTLVRFVEADDDHA